MSNSATHRLAAVVAVGTAWCTRQPNPPRVRCLLGQIATPHWQDLTVKGMPREYFLIGHVN